jgi:hypothetical protein
MTLALVHVPKKVAGPRWLAGLATPVLLAGLGFLNGRIARGYKIPDAPHLYLQPVIADAFENSSWQTRYVLGNIAETQFRDRRKGECTVYYQQITACEKGGR